MGLKLQDVEIKLLVSSHMHNKVREKIAWEQGESLCHYRF